MPVTSPLTVGVDAHIVTGKYQGSRTYLVNMLHAIGTVDPVNRYVIYSHDSSLTRTLLPFPNFSHRRLPVRTSIARLLLYWPYAQMAHGLDYLLTTYISPFVFRRRQLLIVHDILFESHPELFDVVMRWRSRALVRLSASRAQAILTISRFTQHELTTRYGIAPHRIVLTYCGRNEPASGGASGVSGVSGPYFLYVGRIEPRKNLRLLVNAFLRLPRRDGISLVIVGRAERSAMAELHTLQHDARIVHRQDLSQPELDAAYAGATAVVYPSSAEGFGLPVLEALAHRRPVICSPHTALPEAGGPFARYVDPAAPDAEDQLVARMRETLAAENTIDEAALSRHLAQFEWRRSAAEFVAMLSRLGGARVKPDAAISS